LKPIDDGRPADSMKYSQFQRSFRSLKPSQAARAFAPVSNHAVRYASTDAARDGKIHQVIGAVVDGV
jgi:F-type H+-transporting ATPase subunit beta